MPTSTADVVRAGLLADRVTLYRHDLFPSNLLFKNPHPFVVRTDNAVMKDIAVAAQHQIGRFFASDGATVIDPDGSGNLFETPAAAIPDDFGFVL